MARRHDRRDELEMARSIWGSLDDVPLCSSISVEKQVAGTRFRTTESREKPVGLQGRSDHEIDLRKGAEM